MELDDDERQALREEGVDPDDPQVVLSQQRVSKLLRCYGIWLRS
ncbi:hypothetical protein [Nocardia sp. NBC_00511]